MPNLTPRENFLLVLDHKIPEWIPLMKNDAYFYWPFEVAERAPGDGSVAQTHGGTGFDWFGVHWTFQPDIGASMVSHDPILKDITRWKEVIKFPDLDAIDWAAAAKRDSHTFDPQKLMIISVLNGPFERLHALMGMDEACCALLLEPEAVFEFFTAITDHKIKLMQKLITHFPVDIIEFHDDWGHQNNSFFSPELWKDLILPNVKRLTDAGKKNGIRLKFHSCGKVENLIDLMVEAGIKGWSSAQTVNNIENIIKKYGDRLVVFGGMDLELFKSPDLTEAQIKTLVGERIENLCRGAAFVPANASTIPILQNFITMQLDEHRDFFKNPENCKLPK